VVKVDPQAELRYAGCLLLGLGGVERDPLAAVAVFEGLVADGEPRAMAYLALCLEGGAENAQNGVAPDGSRAVALYEAAVAAGDSLAHAQLARILHDGCCKGGHPVPQDPERAARLYKVGADAGDPLSRHMYACALDAGLGVERDAEAAFAMFEENSKVFWESMLHVAGHYAMGRGKGKEDSSAYVMDRGSLYMYRVSEVVNGSCISEYPNLVANFFFFFFFFFFWPGRR
jgi:TPR repeat protein